MLVLSSNKISSTPHLLFDQSSLPSLDFLVRLDRIIQKLLLHGVIEDYLAQQGSHKNYHARPTQINPVPLLAPKTYQELLKLALWLKQSNQSQEEPEVEILPKASLNIVLSVAPKREIMSNLYITIQPHSKQSPTSLYSSYRPIFDFFDITNPTDFFSPKKTYDRRSDQRFKRLKTYTDDSNLYNSKFIDFIYSNRDENRFIAFFQNKKKKRCQVEGEYWYHLLSVLSRSFKESMLKIKFQESHIERIFSPKYALSGILDTFNAQRLKQNANLLQIFKKANTTGNALTQTQFSHMIRKNEIKELHRALEVAVIADNLKAVSLLLATKINPNPYQFSQRSPLYMACFHQHTQIIDELLKHRWAECRSDYYLQSPLYFAVFSENRNLTKKLLSHPNIDLAPSFLYEKWDLDYWHPTEEITNRWPELQKIFPHTNPHQYQAGLYFSLMVYLSDGFLEINKNKSFTSIEIKQVRFLSITQKLPMDLQMVLANRLVASSHDVISTQLAENSLCILANRFTYDS